MADFATTINAAVLAAIAGKTAGTLTQNMYTDAGDTTRNASLFTNINLTCVSAKTSNAITLGFNVTLVAPQFALAAHHTFSYIGETATWVGTDNTAYSATVLNVMQVTGVPGMTDAEIDTDVVLLGSIIPAAITPAKLLPSNASTFLAGISNLLAFAENQTRKLGVTLGQVYAPTFTTAGYTPSNDTQAATFYLPVIGGDSSCAITTSVNGDTVLLGQWHSINNAPPPVISYAPFYSGFLARISATMTSLAATCPQFATASMAGFDVVSGQTPVAAPSQAGALLTNYLVVDPNGAGNFTTLDAAYLALLTSTASHLSGALYIACASGNMMAAAVTISEGSMNSNNTISSITIASLSVATPGIVNFNLTVNRNANTTDFTTNHFTIALQGLKQSSTRTIAVSVKGNTSTVFDRIWHKPTNSTAALAYTADGSVGGTQSFTMQLCPIKMYTSATNAKPVQITITKNASVSFYDLANSIDMTGCKTGSVGVSITGTNAAGFSTGTISHDAQHNSILANSAATGSSYVINVGTSGTYGVATSSGYCQTTDTNGALFGVTSITGLLAKNFWSIPNGEFIPDDFIPSTYAATNGTISTTSTIATDFFGNAWGATVNAGAMLAVLYPLPFTITRTGADVLLYLNPMLANPNFTNTTQYSRTNTYSVYRDGVLIASGIQPADDGSENFVVLTYTDTGKANAPHLYTVLALDGGGNVVASGTATYALPNYTAEALCLGLL